MNLQEGIYYSFMHTNMLEFHPVSFAELELMWPTRHNRHRLETTNIKLKFSKWLKPMYKVFPYVQIQNTGLISFLVTFIQLCLQENRILGLH